MRRGWREIVDDAKTRGWEVEPTKKGFCLKWPGGGMYHIHTCGGDFRALAHAAKALLRIESGKPAGAH